MTRPLLAALLFFVPLLSTWADETPQLGLPRVTLDAGGRTFSVQIATRPEELTKGLMFRDRLEGDDGMLFVLGSPQRASFWMKNTRVPLSVAYIGPTGIILEIHDLEPLNLKTVQSAFENVTYALEMRRGWFADNSILPGTRLSGLPRTQVAQ